MPAPPINWNAPESILVAEVVVYTMTFPLNETSPVELTPPPPPTNGLLFTYIPSDMYNFPPTNALFNTVIPPTVAVLWDTIFPVFVPVQAIAYKLSDPLYPATIVQ